MVKTLNTEILLLNSKPNYLIQIFMLILYRSPVQNMLFLLANTMTGIVYGQQKTNTKSIGIQMI